MNILYVLEIVLPVLWLVGFLGFTTGDFIHISLAITMLAVMLIFIRGRRPFEQGLVD